jgi:hypothetical protein
VDDEDGGASGGNIGDAEEVDVVLGNGHDGVVVCRRDTGHFLIRPCDGGTIPGSERPHVERVQFALRQSI